MNDDYPEDDCSLATQLEALRNMHRELDETIAQLTIKPGDDELMVRRLKKRKLLLKDKIQMIERALDPDEFA